MNATSFCGKKFQKTIRAGAFSAKYEAKCLRPLGHDGKCDDMPFLRALRNGSEAGLKAANKIERDAVLTRGIAWKTVASARDTSKKRPNRCIRWEFPREHKDYDIHYASYETCLEVAKVLASITYRMGGAPPPDAITTSELSNLDGPGYVCPICREPIPLELFLKAKRSKAEVDTAHYPIPQRSGGKHRPDNIAFIHHTCNVAQGNRTGPEFIQWLKGILKRHGYVVEKSTSQLEHSKKKSDDTLKA